MYFLRLGVLLTLRPAAYHRYAHLSASLPFPAFAFLGSWAALVSAASGLPYNAALLRAAGTTNPHYDVDYIVRVFIPDFKPAVGWLRASVVLGTETTSPTSKPISRRRL